MPDWLNGDNLTTVLVVLLALWEVLKAVAPRTTTKIDDSIVDGVEWAKGSAPHAWAIAEVLAAQGSIPKVQKAAAFALKLREAYLDATGKVLPEKAMKEAEMVAAGLSAADKLTRLDPPPGPPSR